MCACACVRVCLKVVQRAGGGVCGGGGGGGSQLLGPGVGPAPPRPQRAQPLLPPQPVRGLCRSVFGRSVFGRSDFGRSVFGRSAPFEAVFRNRVSEQRLEKALFGTATCSPPTALFFLTVVSFFRHFSTGCAAADPAPATGGPRPAAVT